MAKHPSTRVSLDQLIHHYGATHFRTALARYVVLANTPQINATDLERALWNVHIPLRKFAVWHRIKFLRTDPFTGKTTVADSTHLSMLTSSQERSQQLIPSMSGLLLPHR